MMTGIAEARRGSSKARWSRPGSASASVLDGVASLAAIAALVAQAAGIIAQSPAGAPEKAAANADRAALATPASPPVKEWMLAAYGGAPYTYPSEVRVKKEGQHDFAMKPVEWFAEPFDSPIYYGARIVRWFEGGRTGAMLDFTHSKAIAERDNEAEFSGLLDGAPAPQRAKIADVFRRLEATHGHNMLTLNGLLRLPALHARLIPYVGLGAGVSLPHSEVQMIKDRGRTYEYQYAGPVVQAVIGLEFRVPRMSYFVEYKFSLAEYEMPLSQQDGSILFFDLWRQFSRWWRGEAPPGGHLQTRFTSHQVIAGLGVRMGAAPAAMGQ